MKAMSRMNMTPGFAFPYSRWNPELRSKYLTYEEAERLHPGTAEWQAILWRRLG